MIIGVYIHGLSSRWGCFSYEVTVDTAGMEVLGDWCVKNVGMDSSEVIDCGG